jgi:hypothetical protein
MPTDTVQWTVTVQWSVALALGAAIIFVNSWSQFDEPSYDTQSEALKPYKPRFTTYPANYFRAKLIYLSAFFALLLAFSYVPDLFFALFPDRKSDDLSLKVLPVIIALALMTGARTPPTKDLERKLRSFFHSVANIPEGVRKTIGQIRRSGYQPDDDKVESQTAKLDAANGGRPLERSLVASLIRDDVVTKLWHSTGALLSSLSPDNRATVDLDPSFFETFHAELSSIEDKHDSLAKPVRRHIEEIASNPSLLRPNIVNDSDTMLQKELETVRERLYAFAACAVRSSVKTETESLNTLKQLGFASPKQFHLKASVRTTILMIIQFSLLGILVLSVFTSFSTGMFSDAVLRPLGSEWEHVFPIPTAIGGTYAWTWTTAIFYAAAILTTIGMREAKISQRKWFDLNTDRRRRPIENYAGPTLIGTAVGGTVLVLIAYIDGPGFQFSIPGLSELQEGVRLSLPWIPLAGAMSFISLWLVDSDLKVRDWRAVAASSLAGGAIMGIIGLFTALYSMKTTVQVFADTHHLGAENVAVQGAVIKVSVFIAFQIGVITTLLCAVVLISQILIGKAQSLCASALTIATFRGTLFTILLDRGGAAHLVPQGAGSANACRAPREGRWIHFPEGTVVRWNEPDGGSHDPTAGIFTSSEGNLVYEEYDGEIAGDAMSVAHLDRRTTYEPSSFNWKDLLTNARPGY